MILKTVSKEDYFAAKFVECAKQLVNEEGSPFDENHLLSFLKLSVAQPIGNELLEFNYKYFSFPHFNRKGMYDGFDNPSEEWLTTLISFLEKNIPLDVKLKVLYSLTCNKILSLIIEDLKELGDEEFAKLIDIELVKVLRWSVK